MPQAVSHGEFERFQMETEEQNYFLEVAQLQYNQDNKEESKTINKKLI